MGVNQKAGGWETSYRRVSLGCYPAIIIDVIFMTSLQVTLNQDVLIERASVYRHVWDH